MEFRLLGRLEAEHDGRVVEVGRRRERALLGILLLVANTPVSVERLVDLLWEGEPPAGARDSLRIHVSRLRRVFDPDGTGGLGVRVVAGHGGYLVEVERDRVDAHRFRDLVAAARSADGADRTELLRRALGLWRGTLLADAIAERVRDRLGSELVELQLSAAELLIDSELAAGRHREVIGEVATLAAEHPYREHFTGQLMLALYRSNRHGDALSVYTRLRDRLADELGVDTGPRLRELHAGILRRDTALLTTAEPNPETSTVPRQLPGCPVGFTGRSRELDAVSAALSAVVARGAGEGVAIAAISGVGGIGKTWLALYWAHMHRERFPDGQMFVDLRGYDPSGQPVEPSTAVRGFLEALGLAPERVPRTVAAQVGMYRGLVAGRRMLIVLDNARDADQVLELLPGSASCTVLVTSRDRLAGLVNRHGAVPVLLDVLDEEQAGELLVDRLGPELSDAQPQAVRALVAGCGGLPLALGIVAARAATEPGLGLAAIATEVNDAGTRLGALDGSEALTSVRAVLSWSYRALPAQSAQVFGLLGLAPGPDIGLGAAAALTGLPAPEVMAVLRGLERQCLIQQHVPGRWRMHDLVRLYAAERAAHDQSTAARRAAMRRVVDFYLRTACAADKLLSPHRPPIAVSDPAFGAEPQPLMDVSAARAWLDVEHPCLLAAQRLANAEDWPEPAWQLAWALYTHHHRLGYHHVQVDMWRSALDAAERAADRLAQIQSHRFLGRTCAHAGRHREAIEHLGRALELAEQSGDVLLAGHCQMALSTGWHLAGDDERGLEHAVDAVRVYRRFDDPAWLAVALNGAGWYAARLGRYDKAEELLREALDLHQTFREPSYHADALSSMGYLAHQRGQHLDALAYYERALALNREVGSFYAQTETLTDLGGIHATLGNRSEARRAWRQAVTLFRDLHRHADAERVLRKLSRLG